VKVSEQESERAREQANEKEWECGKRSFVCLSLSLSHECGKISFASEMGQGIWCKCGDGMCRRRHLSTDPFCGTSMSTSTQTISTDCVILWKWSV